MTPEIYHSLEAEFGKIYILFAPVLPSDSKDSIQHYCTHGELEMAVEGFCLDIIEKNAVLPEQIRLSLVELCQSLHLDQESVFAFDFWERFQQYLRDQQAGKATSKTSPKRVLKTTKQTVPIVVEVTLADKSGTIIEMKRLPCPKVRSKAS